MSMIPNSPDNRVLAASVNARIAADARMVSARAAMCWLAGFGIMAALIGSGIGAACYGYAYVHDPRTSVQKMAEAFASALQGTTFTATGEVALKSGASVELDTTGATVKLDPAARMDLPPRPSPEQLGGGSSRTGSGAPVFTSYTVFKEAPFGRGAVVTGWRFISDDQRRPSKQYCYYNERIEHGLYVHMDFAEDGNLLPDTDGHDKFDPLAAFEHCVWFPGEGVQSRNGRT
jgi:hypothetical protein